MIWIINLVNNVPDDFDCLNSVFSWRVGAAVGAAVGAVATYIGLRTDRHSLDKVAILLFACTLIMKSHLFYLFWPQEEFKQCWCHIGLLVY
jgi:hypothetical protein